MKFKISFLALQNHHTTQKAIYNHIIVTIFFLSRIKNSLLFLVRNECEFKRLSHFYDYDEKRKEMRIERENVDVVDDDQRG